MAQFDAFSTAEVGPVRATFRTRFAGAASTAIEGFAPAENSEATVIRTLWLSSCGLLLLGCNLNGQPEEPAGGRELGIGDVPSGSGMSSTGQGSGSVFDTGATGGDLNAEPNTASTEPDSPELDDPADDSITDEGVSGQGGASSGSADASVASTGGSDTGVSPGDAGVSTGDAAP